jgi:hypothetical protein
VILGCVAETPFVTVTDGAVVGFGMAVTSGPGVDADHEVIDSVPFVLVTETTRNLPASAATGVYVALAAVAVVIAEHPVGGVLVGPLTALTSRDVQRNHL